MAAEGQIPILKEDETREPVPRVVCIVWRIGTEADLRVALRIVERTRSWAGGAGVARIVDDYSAAGHTGISRSHTKPTPRHDVDSRLHRDSGAGDPDPGVVDARMEDRSAAGWHRTLIAVARSSPSNGVDRVTLARPRGVRSGEAGWQQVVRIRGVAGVPVRVRHGADTVFGSGVYPVILPETPPTEVMVPFVEVKAL